MGVTVSTARPVRRGLALLAGLAVLALAACDEREVILPGKREDPRAVLATEAPAPEAPANRVAPISLPAPQMNADWLQRQGTPATRVAHPALSAAPRLAWSADIGAGDSRRIRITADPVVSGGRVFTLDAQATVTATSTAGQTLWQRSLVPARDGANDATGGGLAYGGGKLFVSSDFGLLTALDPASGAVLWQQELNAVGNGTPTYANGVVYLVSGDSVSWAVDADTGRIRWQLGGAPVLNKLLGGPAPAVSDGFVVFPHGNGEVAAVFRKNGLRRWETYVSGRRDGYARANVQAITGDPVVVGDTVYVATLGGRLAALNLNTGDRRWLVEEGAVSPLMVAGGSVFLVSDRNELLRLDAATGDRIWGVELPFFTGTRPKKQAEVFAHYGPVLAGGRIVVASNDGTLRMFDPRSGAMVAQIEVPGGATVNPAVAGGTLYVVSSDGKLLAYR